MKTGTLLGAMAVLLGQVVVVAAGYSGRNNFIPESWSGLTINGVPPEVRDYWMGQAILAVPQVTGHPCPYAPAGTVIVIHHPTWDEELCRGANRVWITGDPTLHGESDAMVNCTKRWTEEGKTGPEMLEIWKQASLYTSHEPCSMCSSTLRFAQFKEVIYGSSVKEVHQVGGRPQIAISSYEIVEKSFGLGGSTTWIPGVLSEEALATFGHQHNQSAPCPAGCERQQVPGARYPVCAPIESDTPLRLHDEL
ncbi:hypothetical protein IAT38_000738 [Cryptococcus sp. DSM 104549]